MSSSHKAGSDSGVDRGLVTIFLVWIAITVVLVVMLVVEARCHSVQPFGPGREMPLSTKPAV